MNTYLTDNVRIDDSILRELNSDVLFEIGRRYRSRKIRVLADYVHQRKGSFYHE
jgi:hypothetical protein